MPVPEFARSGRRFLLRLRDLHLPRPALAYRAGPAVRRALLVPACAGLTLAAACGGGGADSPTTPPPPPPPPGPGAPATAVATGATSVIGRAGESLTGPFGVTVRDARGTAVPNVSVACAVESGGGSIGATSATTASDGSASCGAWTLGGALGSQALRVTVGALAPVQFAATVTAGPVNSLLLEQPLSTTVRSGVAPTARPIIRIRDRFGNDVAEAGISITAAVANATLAGATAITNTSGRAEFTALVVSGLAGARTISFSAPGASAPVTGQFTLEAGLAAVVAFVTPPPTTLAAGAIVAPAVQVALRDDAGNPVAETGRAVTATVSGATVANGTATTGADGRATFTGLTIGGIVGARSLVVTAASLASPATAPFTLTPGAATALTLGTAAPTGVRSGVPLSTAPQLQLRDTFGNAVPAAGVAVLASVSSATMAIATLANGSAQTDATGRATFTGLTVSGLVGARTLAFTAGALTAPSPVAFTLQSGPAAVLAVVRDAPSNLTSGFELVLPPIVQLRDAAGNDADDAGVAVRAVATGSALTLVNATAVTNAIGRATFAGFGAVATAGAASFRYESGSLPPVTAATTSIVAPAGDQVPATIEFGAPAVRAIVLDPGQAQTPGLVVRNGVGAALTGALVERVSRDAVVVEVSSTGAVTGRSTGRSIVTARVAAAGSVSDSLVVHVTRGANVPLVYTDLQTQRLVRTTVVEVRVFADGRGSGALSGVTLDVAYPRAFPNMLRLDEVIPSAGTVANASVIAGLVRLSWVNSAGVSGPIELVRLRFTVVGGVGEFSQLVLTPLDVFSSALSLLTTITSPVNPPFTIVNP